MTRDYLCFQLYLLQFCIKQNRYFFSLQVSKHIYTLLHNGIHELSHTHTHTHSTCINSIHTYARAQTLAHKYKLYKPQHNKPCCQPFPYPDAVHLLLYFRLSLDFMNTTRRPSAHISPNICSRIIKRRTLQFKTTCTSYLQQTPCSLTTSDSLGVRLPKWISSLKHVFPTSQKW